VALRIPRTVRLPFGFNISVRQVTRAEMKDACECDGDEEGPDGLWDAEEMVIYLVRTLPVRRRRYVLCHELQHAVVDLMHAQLDDGVGRP